MKSGDDMRKGGKSDVYADINEMVTRHDRAIDELTSFLPKLVKQISMDVNRLNMLTLGLMKELELVEEYTCPCGLETLIPKLAAIETEDNCPQCQAPIGDKPNVTLDDYVSSEEE